MKRIWLLFAQAVTVLLAAYFVVATLKPEWLNKRSTSLGGVVSIVEAPPGAPSVAAAGSLSVPAKKASPAVVSINTSKAAQRHPRSNDPWFRFFFGDQDDQPQMGLGSGVIVSPDGYILTNNHVVEGADEIEVTLNDSRHARGKVIGTDPDTDLAVLKIELDKLPVIVLGDSDALQVGDQVLAIGNPFGVGQTVTSGIVSALGRNQLGINNFENFIQTDAAINPGNSGGALIDVNGNLQGINTAIYSRSGGSMGIGFAIPVSMAKIVLEGIVKEGQVRRGWIGVEPNELSPELGDLRREGGRGGDHHRRAAERPGRQGRHPPGRRDHLGGREEDRQRAGAADRGGRPETGQHRAVRAAARQRQDGAGRDAGAAAEEPGAASAQPA
jgi:serine protease DegQ